MKSTGKPLEKYIYNNVNILSAILRAYLCCQRQRDHDFSNNMTISLRHCEPCLPYNRTNRNRAPTSFECNKAYRLEFLQRPNDLFL